MAARAARFTDLTIQDSATILRVRNLVTNLLVNLETTYRRWPALQRSDRQKNEETSSSLREIMAMLLGVKQHPMVVAIGVCGSAILQNISALPPAQHATDRIKKMETIPGLRQIVAWCNLLVPEVPLGRGHA